MMPSMDYTTIDLLNKAIAADSARPGIEQVVSQGDTISNVWTFRTPDNNILFLGYDPESNEATIYVDERRVSDLGDMRTELRIQKLDNGAITVERVDNNANLIIGRRTAGASGAISGTVDEVRIYEEALTSSQIERIYAQGLEKHKNLANK